MALLLRDKLKSPNFKAKSRFFLNHAHQMMYNHQLMADLQTPHPNTGMHQDSRVSIFIFGNKSGSGRFSDFNFCQDEKDSY